MGCLQLDDHVFSVEYLLKASQYLLVETLLDLWAATEVLNDAVQLGKTDHLPVAVVTDLGNSGEQQEVVLTH